MSIFGPIALFGYGVEKAGTWLAFVCVSGVGRKLYSVALEDNETFAFERFRLQSCQEQ